MKKRLIIIWLALTAPLVSFANANWMEIGGGYYVDKNNVVRAGDLSIVTYMHGATRAGGEIVFDCKREIIVRNGENGYTGAISKDSGYAVAYKVACKKAWQFWK